MVELKRAGIIRKLDAAVTHCAEVLTGRAWDTVFSKFVPGDSDLDRQTDDPAWRDTLVCKRVFGFVPSSTGFRAVFDAHDIAFLQHYTRAKLTTQVFELQMAGGFVPAGDMDKWWQFANGPGLIMLAFVALAHYLSKSVQDTYTLLLERRVCRPLAPCEQVWEVFLAHTASVEDGISLSDTHRIMTPRMRVPYPISL